MGYGIEQAAPDQVPLRAIEAGLISEKGFIDPTDGGRVERYSANAEWRGPVPDGSSHWRAQAYALKYRMQLYSNFTYVFTDPDDSDPGTRTLADQQPDDQFYRFDDRRVYGLNTSRAWPVMVGAVRDGSRPAA